MFGITTTLKADPFREPQDYEVPTLGSVMGARPFFEGGAVNAGVKQDYPKTVPTPDNRYSEYAGNMADGRIATDYRPNCVSRAPYGHQNATKEWLVKNADEVVHVSRIRQAETSGAIYGARYYGPKPEAVQHVTAYSSKVREVASGSGLGTERAQATAAPADAYFGSFDPTQFNLTKPAKHIGLTRRSEGGANGAASGRKPVDSTSRLDVMMM